MAIPAPEFVDQEVNETLFLVEPYVPTQGIVFFYGKKGLGKSPLTWELARCIASGQSFLGRPTRQGTVLYVEADTPAILVRRRLQALPQPLPDRWFLEFVHPFNVLAPHDPIVKRLRACEDDIHPDLVIVNTLRKVHFADDKESNIPARVYGTFQAIFPHAAFWFTHHDKKTGDPTITRNADEEFSGTQAWINDATVGLHLVKSGANKGVLRLDHTKSQVSEQVPAVSLQLEDDGSNIGLFAKSRGERVTTVYLALEGGTVRERVAKTAQALGVSESTVWRALTDRNLGGGDSNASG